MKNKILLFLFIFFVPFVINAKTYGDALNGAEDYLERTDFKSSYSKYLHTPTNSGLYYKEDSSRFKLGGLISYEEFMTTLINNSNINYSYLYESKAFWTLTSGLNSNTKIVIKNDFPSVSSKPTATNVQGIGYKVTEYVQPKVNVFGRGTYGDPWIFAPQFRVVIKVNDIDKGALKDSSGNEVSQIELNILAGANPLDIKFVSKGTNQYIGNTCGPILNGGDANSDSNPRLVLSNVTRDIECIVNFGERPLKVVLDQFDNNNGNSKPEVLYLLKNRGWFNDIFANTLISTIIDNPSKLGYTYKGYYNSADSSTACSGTKVIDADTKKISMESSVLNDIVDGDRLYPCYNANKYKVRYNANTGSGNMSDVEHTYGISKNLTANSFTKTGYSFSRWNTSANGTGSGSFVNQESVLNLASEQDFIVNLYAQWSAHTYAITYDLNGGNSFGTSHPTSAAFDSTFKVDDPSRVGYDFVGWTVTSGLNTSTAKYGSSVTSANTELTSSSTKVTSKYFKNLTPNNGGSVTLTANWNARTDTKYVVRHYKQKLNADDTYNTSNYVLENTQQLTGTSDVEVTPKRNTYTGFTSPNGQKVTINADGSGVLNYYYKRTHYNVTLEANDSSFGTVSVSSVSLDYGNTFSVDGATLSFGNGSSSKANATTAAGYTTTFSNWSTASGDITGATTLTAIFNRVGNPYTVKYNSNNGSGTMNDTSCVYGSDCTLRTNTFTRTNYEFLGWSTDKNATSASYTNGGTYTKITTNSSVTLYAVWKVLRTCKSGGTLTNDASKGYICITNKIWDSCGYPCTGSNWVDGSCWEEETTSWYNVSCNGYCPTAQGGKCIWCGWGDGSLCSCPKYGTEEVCSDGYYEYYDTTCYEDCLTCPSGFSSYNSSQCYRTAD